MDEDVRRAFVLLELEPGASRAQAKQAFRDLAQVWHPDRFAHSERLKARAATRFQEINTAYAVVCTWIERHGSAPPPPPAADPTPRPRPAPPPGPSATPDRREAARRAEAQRRKWQPLGPWEGLDLDHAVLRGPGDGQVLCVSQVTPMPFVHKAFEAGLLEPERWVTTVAAGPGQWLTAVSRWAKVKAQRVDLSPTVEGKMKFVGERYAEGFSMTAYAESAGGLRLTVMTDGPRLGSEHYASHAEWPREAIRAARRERDEAVVLSAGARGRWHVVTAQVDGWTGQRIALRDSYKGFEEAVQVAWGEQRRISSVGWLDGTWAVVSTSLPGWVEQSHGHARDTAKLARMAAEQWAKGRVLTSACYDDDGWLCVWTTHDQWG